MTLPFEATDTDAPNLLPPSPVKTVVSTQAPSTLSAVRVPTGQVQTANVIGAAVHAEKVKETEVVHFQCAAGIVWIDPCLVDEPKALNIRRLPGRGHSRVSCSRRPNERLSASKRRACSTRSMRISKARKIPPMTRKLCINRRAK